MPRKVKNKKQSKKKNVFKKVKIRVKDCYITGCNMNYN